MDCTPIPADGALAVVVAMPAGVVVATPEVPAVDPVATFSAWMRMLVQ